MLLKVDKLVVIQSLTDNETKKHAPLDEETILFDSRRRAISKIFEIFGPVAIPFYSIRFNSLDEIETRELDLQIGSHVFYAPECKEYTKFIFNVDELRQEKGSDASWNHDNEPPVECIEYSDDEAEKLAKKKLKNKNKTTTTAVDASSSDDSDSDTTDVQAKRPLAHNHQPMANKKPNFAQNPRQQNYQQQNNFQAYLPQSQPPQPPPSQQTHSGYWHPPPLMQMGMAASNFGFNQQQQQQQQQQQHQYPIYPPNQQQQQPYSNMFYNQPRPQFFSQFQLRFQYQAQQQQQHPPPYMSNLNYNMGQNQPNQNVQQQQQQQQQQHQSINSPTANNQIVDRRFIQNKNYIKKSF
jgi:rRNA processing protein Gar1